ncbi:hypothetical protein SUNI508_14103 [Seiridium unicorne]|uniref:Uncharacterized protein n=1 Tax=Seiridium unicorne TaxID=138068 RepID=A0ABR2UYE4_9PEZI
MPTSPSASVVLSCSKRLD